MRYDYRDRVIQTAVRELSERILTLEEIAWGFFCSFVVYCR